jgi:site-specific recombinase XerD
MDHIATFTTALQAEGKSSNTIKNYTVAVKQLLKAHKNDPARITQESLDTFFSGFNARNQTQNLKKNAINKFLAFMYARKHIKTPFFIKIKGMTAPEPEYLSKAEQERFFEVLDSDPQKIRDYTLFATMLFTGMRVGEVVQIKLKDIQDDHIIIRDSKTGAGKVYVREKLKSLLYNYLTTLSPAPKLNDYIFLSKQKRRISERMVQLSIKKYLKLAGINKELTPHGLRHTFAARLRQSGSDIEIIQRSLRHGHIQSSTRYTHISDSNLQDAIEKSVKLPKK